VPGESAEPRKIERFICPGCGAAMVFDPQSAELKCTACGHLDALPEPGTVASHPYLEALKNNSGRAPLSDQAKEIHCQGCGSVVAFVPPDVAGNCSFCGSPLVAEPKAADPLVAPDGVLPAKIAQPKAQTQIQEWLQSRWFAPNALKRLAHQEGVNGVYLPFWVYDCDTYSDYTGEKGIYYYTTETYEESDGRGGTVTRTRQVRHTAWYPASGHVSQAFHNVLIPATKSVSEKRLNKLAPWGLNALCAYEPAYLAGFKAQRYQLELPEGFEKAKVAMEPTIESDVRHDIGGDEQRITTLNTEYSNILFRHLLLPVWMGAYQFKGESYQVLVNAATGEVQGERPYSAVKIFFLVLVIVAIIILIAYLKGNS
jgi:hypothetical protein